MSRFPEKSRRIAPPYSILPNKLILDANSMSKLIGKYVTKIVYIYDQSFKVVGNLVSTLDVGF